MNDDWTEVGEVTDGSGKKIVIAWAEDKVRFAVKAPIKSGLHLTTIVLDGPARAEFLGLIANAGRQAEATADAGDWFEVGDADAGTLPHPSHPS